jgi:beta-glucosidase
VADVLFGDYNPSGKLPITFYKNIKQLPGYEDYSMKGRTYRYMTDEPLFPFGYGLSYTTFKIGEAKVDRTAISKSESLRLTVPVTNTGRRDGVEILQVYLHKQGDADAPLRSLCGFQRVQLRAGTTQRAVMDLPSSAFACFDTATNTVCVTPGQYDLYYGTSSSPRDLKKINITITDTVQ